MRLCSGLRFYPSTKEHADKQARVVNRQGATIVSAHNRTIILRLPEGQRVFVYPVTSIVDDAPITYYPFMLVYAQTIMKSQGQNIRHLVLWLDSAIVPAGTGYVGCSIHPPTYLGFSTSSCKLVRSLCTMHILNSSHVIPFIGSECYLHLFDATSFFFPTNSLLPNCNAASFSFLLIHLSTVK